MKHLILSDIHGNLDALVAVLRQVRHQSFDSVVVLGDLVGYGAAPDQVIDRVRRFGSHLTIVRGNHDKVIAGIEHGMGFNPIALASVMWSRNNLKQVNRSYLAALPEGPLEVDGFLISHGSPVDEDLYVVSESIAAEVFAGCEFSLCFFGHTHLPCIFVADTSTIASEQISGEERCWELEPGLRYLINPGSIGQPRDRDPRAAYMTYDSDSRSVRWHRVEYRVPRAQRRIRRAGLPEVLAERLEHGI